MTFSLPNLVLVPLLSDVQEVVTSISMELLSISNNIYWWDGEMKQQFTESIDNDPQLREVRMQIDQAIVGKV